ncbi:CRISPR-associated endoribonuclease Cas6 [Hydrogenimonas thermophila]|uniref:CRISPR associated protein Cas6 n=1 Tax=Hydrogenimonas thermophila TaxID=223786 RepID=A0A1I5RKE2_9BACT|nr:CRISPR-associated endoribonuclease Cas6 [Hydrogenimonas thermophila]WOE69683.1 CRISPR-associated endoribonuclease Cas6 [Hydrogenimonas thermophila]WOE72197.1 CRISPR-associated endoribonuclease Cas6 [Hydrogenimonas thermophila]SFP59029.1 CRISPR associated protein Cas6 [Hydrogenimonas thermophila]
MLHITARTSTKNLLIQKSMSKLFQSFLYSHLPEKEHQGYESSTGKLFKSVNFRIFYFDDRFEIDFTALDKSYEQMIAIEILKNGLKLGEIYFAETTVGFVDRQLGEDVTKMVVRGDVCAAIKNRVTGKKIFLEPGDSRHTEIITNHTLQKFEALLGKPYTKELLIEPLWQSLKPRTFWYEKTPYIAWFAKYKIQADSQMLNLLLDTGLGGDSMKNLGFLEVVK